MQLKLIGADHYIATDRLDTAHPVSLEIWQGMNLKLVVDGSESRVTFEQVRDLYPMIDTQTHAYEEVAGHTCNLTREKPLLHFLVMEFEAFKGTGG